MNDASTTVPGPVTIGAVTVRAAAKVNLCLGVGPVRADGFHPLATVYQAIGMYDDVTLAPADAWQLQVRAHERIDVSEVPLDQSNIALRAGRLLAAHHELDRSALIVIDKGIPVAGGLAGGSADAAATLLGLDRMWALHTPDDELLALAAQLGSDVPFALVGGTARGDGRGEIVERVADGGSWWWVVVESDVGLSTARVYGEYDRLRPDAPQPVVPELLLKALAAGEPGALAACLANDLHAPALHLRPDLAAVLEQGERAGALRGIVSGSGPTCVFLCADHDTAHAVRHALEESGHTRVQVANGAVAGAHVVEYA
ncbi:MAG: 4-(cytidine 5'-diphospho)-2-C-methyl-D-erythritol kinase [Marmoricola sp.]